ncbi:putative aldouronate transport system permease protein [Paenibacillus sp. UNC496MF]|uniref:carbohydrate ABC transporter permease n=1 Tax=Paenibacillus sp. UNC496MF TaxID=1502753 RepID=UPI0008ECC5B8|nr:carbohydrate ABC transporter permease [Paenibacillus sp. UNC496MF]SFI27116.1 putative aldouronate transport system permease protein [Paenibacillus sp. UNC496MF]
MHAKASAGTRVFHVFNLFALTLTSVVCLIPFVHIVSLSFSDKAAVMGGLVKLWPVHFTLDPYRYVLQREAFWHAFGTTLGRVAIGATLNVLLVILLAYPLSKTEGKLRMRTVYVWIFFFTMLFNGGLIPNYILVKELHLLDTLGALVLPGAVGVFNIVLLLNFFREVPAELEDAAFIDGAGHWRTLWRIYVPVSLPAIATVALFCIVGHWNAWFDGMIYMKVNHYPLQTYLQSIVIKFDFNTMSPEEAKRLAKLNDRSIKSAQMIVAVIPVLMVYPYLQKYFVTGIRLGSVKG